MTMHKALHPRDDVVRLYVSRKEGGRGLASIEDSVEASIQRLKDYIQKHEGGLVTATRNETENTMNNRMTITRQFDDILLRHCNAVYNQNTIDRWMKGCILPFPKKGDLGLAKNYRGITLTSIAVKIYNALLRNRIEPKIDHILRKNQNGFRRNRSTTAQILTIHWILEGVRTKNLQATLLFVDFTKAFDSIHRGKMEQILQAYGLPQETVAAITILHRSTKVKVRSPDGDRILQHCCRSTTRRHASSIPHYHLFRLRA